MLDAMPDRRLGKFLPPLLGAWLKLGEGDIESALATIAPLGETEGLTMLYHLQVALLNDVANRPAEAEAAYRTTLTNTSTPSLRTTWLIGNFFERQGKAEDASQVYEQFRTAEPGTQHHPANGTGFSKVDGIGALSACDVDHLATSHQVTPLAEAELAADNGHLVASRVMLEDDSRVLRKVQRRLRRHLVKRLDFRADCTLDVEN